METRKRSNSAHNQQHIPSRPTTPLRPSSRGSLRSSAAVYDSYNPFNPDAHSSRHHYSSGGSGGINALASLEPAFAELADGMADLEANFMHIQLLHESVSRFNENFAALLYGMNMNAFCVDFPEAPLVPDSFRRHAATAATAQDEDSADADDLAGATGLDPDVTIVSTATSFVDHPSAASERAGGVRAAGGIGGTSRGRARAGARGSTTSSSGIGRGRAPTASSASGRGAAAGRGRVSGIARGASSTRGRGIR